MKAVLASVLVLSSCGKINLNSVNSELGIVSELKQEPISSGDRGPFEAVCSALAAKREKLQGTTETFQFQVAETDCDGEGVVSDVQSLKVEVSGEEALFKRADTGASFVFPSVETDRSGVFKEVCSGATSMPIIRGQEALMITSVVSSSNCPNSSNERCIGVSYWKNTGGEHYKKYAEEFLRLKTDRNEGRYGFYTFRKRASSSFCNLGKKITQTVELK